MRCLFNALKVFKIGEGANDLNKSKIQAVHKLNSAIADNDQKLSTPSFKRESKSIPPKERQELIAKARNRFFDYCNLVAPSFYKASRKYLVELCDELQDFYFNPQAEVLIINEPPRHGKSRTATLFATWIFGINSYKKIMTGSYNEKLSTNFSKKVRNTIQEQKLDVSKIIYTDIFPLTKIKRGDAAANFWSLEGEDSSYLATSPTGTATGFGCDILILDDIIKNAYEAYNKNILDNHWNWFTDTMLSRLEEGGKIIIIMTRWATGDLAGRAILHYGDKAKVITMKALQDDGTMLCEEILSKKSYLAKIKGMRNEIAEANYQQMPIDVKGKLYTGFKTYNNIPTFTEILSYCDTADEGADYLCNIIWGVYQNEAYVLDVYYTNASMETTETETAKRLMQFKVSRARIESNNGGKGFARSVKRILNDKFKYSFTQIKWSHQSKNKQARIITNSTWVMDHIYFPANWRDKYPEYYKAMVEYQREGKNAHDDAPDATTGVSETMNILGVR